MLQKISDEGTNSAFFSRLWLGVFDLRDFALGAKLTSDNITQARNQFDNLYKPVLEAAWASRTATQNIQKLLIDHIHKIANGDIIRYQENVFEISENLNKPLRDETAAFLVNGAIAVKNVQKVAELFGLNIGCLVQKQDYFDKGKAELEVAGHRALSMYLADVRTTWSEQFIERRNSLEHGRWSLPYVQYIQKASKKIELIEPEIDGSPISAYASLMLNRSLGFIESIIVYAFKCTLRQPLTIVEIPLVQRDPRSPRRFRLGAMGLEVGIIPWDIRYSDHDYAE